MLVNFKTIGTSRFEKVSGANQTGVRLPRRWGLADIGRRGAACRPTPDSRVVRNCPYRASLPSKTPAFPHG